jgi:hypothetical protein
MSTMIPPLHPAQLRAMSREQLIDHISALEIYIGDLLITKPSGISAEQACGMRPLRMGDPGYGMTRHAAVNPLRGMQDGVLHTGKMPASDTPDFNDLRNAVIDQCVEKPDNDVPHIVRRIEALEEAQQSYHASGHQAINEVSQRVDHLTTGLQNLAGRLGHVLR